MEITSTQNPQIKRLLALQQKSAERRKSGLFVVEGQRELMHCLEAGYEVEQLFVCGRLAPSLQERGLGGESFPSLQERGVEVSPSLYERIAYRGSTEGVIAVVKAKERKLADLQLSACPLIVVLERVEKPGNLGAILRSGGRCSDCLRPADGLVQPEPHPREHRCHLHRSVCGVYVGRVYRLLENQRHTNPYGATTGLSPLLRHGHAQGYGYRDGNGGDGAHGSMA